MIKIGEYYINPKYVTSAYVDDRRKAEYNKELEQYEWATYYALVITLAGGDSAEIEFESKEECEIALEDAIKRIKMALGKEK